MIVIELGAPGFDIVDFEYEATSEADLAKIDAAIATLQAPLKLFVFPEAAGCSVTEASARLIEEDDHDDHADKAQHTEFSAANVLSCTAPDAIDTITFAYFSALEHTEELEIQMVTAVGTQAFEVARDTPNLDVRGAF